MLSISFGQPFGKLLVKLASKTKLFLAWISLGIYLLLSSISITPDMVVCLEADGQIAFEQSTNGFCSDFYEKSSFKTKSNAALQTLKCKNCKDVQLITNNENLSTGTHRAFLLLTSLYPPPLEHLTSIISFSLSTNSQFPHPPPLQLGPHTFLETVKLLV